MPLSCTDLRTQAHDILQKNCAGCHQAPNKMGNFDFILDLDKLTTVPSGTFIGRYYVVKGDLMASLLHSRYMPGGGMPPATAAARPSASDVAVLDAWISNCIGDPTSPTGWAALALPAGPFPACGVANVCPNGGCCVFNQCVPDGTICGPLKNMDATMLPVAGLPGMCSQGSCQKAGAACGKPNEPCCDGNSCTASQSSCLRDTMYMSCSQCGGLGQLCCSPNECLSGNACIGGGVGRTGRCATCGGLNQPCCGTGLAAVQKCDLAANVCVAAAMAGDGGVAAPTNLCQPCGAAGQPCCRNTDGSDMCNGTLNCNTDANTAVKSCGTATADGGVAADASSAG